MKLDAQTRREKILKILSDADSVVSGSEIARQLGVSRQVIVQDIALLRAGNIDILSTPRGYFMVQRKPPRICRKIRVCHNRSQIQEELDLFVDHGAYVRDVIVNHPIYGEIRGELNIRSRRDVRDFIKKVESEEGHPLLEMSGGIHWHTIEADSEEMIEEIREDLKNHGFLLE